MNISREFKELLLGKIDLVDLIHGRVPLQKKSDNNYFARCPFHDEKSASFSVSQAKQFYYCFGCGAHGNAIDFLMQHERLTFPEAIQSLARLSGVEIPENNTVGMKKEASRLALYDLTEKISGYYSKQMQDFQQVLHYLKHRGIFAEIAQQFHLGYASPGWRHIADTFGQTELDRKKLIDIGMIIQKDNGEHYDRFRDRLMFPIHDYRGRIIGFGGRVIAEGEPKYLNSPETSLFQKGHELYGLYQTLKAHRTLDQVIIVEGYMDVITLFQQGITFAVATLGTATTPHHLQRLFRYTANIIFCFDGDQAGKKAAWRALQVALPHLQDQLQIRFLFLPDGEDPDSLIRKEGRAAFEERMQQATSLSGFFFQTISQSCDSHTLEGRARLTALALKYIKQVPAGIFQNLLLEELSQRARVNMNELNKQMKDPREQINAVASSVPDEEPADEAKWALPIRTTIALLIQSPELVALVPNAMPASNLPGYAFLNQLIEIIKKNEKITTGMLLEHYREKSEEKSIIKLSHWQHNIPAAGLNNEFLGWLHKITLLLYEEKINELKEKSSQRTLSNEERIEWEALIKQKKILPN